MASAEDFVEHKQEQKLVVEAPIGQVCYGCATCVPTVFGETIIYDSFVYG